MTDQYHTGDKGKNYLVAAAGSKMISAFCEQHFTATDQVAFIDITEMLLYRNKIPVGRFDHPKDVVACLYEQALNFDMCWIFDPGASDLTPSLLLKIFLQDIQELSVAAIRYVSAANPFLQFTSGLQCPQTWQWIVPPAVLTDGANEYLSTGLLNELGGIVTDMEKKIAGFWAHHALPVSERMLSWPCSVASMHDFLQQLHALPTPAPNTTTIVRYRTVECVPLYTVVTGVWPVVVSSFESVPDEALAIWVNQLLAPYNSAECTNANEQIILLPDLISLEQSMAIIRSCLQLKHLQSNSLNIDVINGMQEKQLMADPAPVKYFIGGTGSETVLIINALGLTVRFWTAAIGLLMKYCKVIVWETQCCDLWKGGMERVITIDQHAAVIHAIISQENITSCHLAGWCNGGRIAIATAAQYPQSIASLSLICPVFRGVSGITAEDTQFEKDQQQVFTAVSRNPAIAGLLASYLVNTNSKLPDPGIKPALALSLPDSTFRNEVIAPMKTGPYLINYAQRTLNDEQYPLMSAVANVQQPTLLILGTEDAVISNQLTEAVGARLPSCRQVTFLGSSHYIQLQQPALLVHVLYDFMYTGRTLPLHQAIHCNTRPSLAGQH